MRKLKLTLEDLQVTSFETREAPADRGTIVGHIPPTAPPRATCYTCEGINSCDPTCFTACDTCGAGSCAGICFTALAGPC